MRRRGGAAACALLILGILTGCVRYPKQAADGADWDAAWTMHGSVLGVDAPEGFTLIQNYAVLTMNGLSFSVWGYGTPEITADETGEETASYAAQLYVLVKACGSGDEARTTAGEWLARLGDTWPVVESREETYNGRGYTVAVCEGGTASGPYSREFAAFGCYGSSAVSAELDCMDAFDGDGNAVLAAFLENCHYSAAVPD